jgi:hypothetical protein
VLQQGARMPAEAEDWVKCWSCLTAKQPAIESVNCVLTL